MRILASQYGFSPKNELSKKKKMNAGIANGKQMQKALICTRYGKDGGNVMVSTIERPGLFLSFLSFFFLFEAMCSGSAS